MLYLLAEKFFERMRSYVKEPASDQLIFSEDLKNVTYLVNEGSEEDIELLITMIRK